MICSALASANTAWGTLCERAITDASFDYHGSVSAAPFATGTLALLAWFRFRSGNFPFRTQRLVEDQSLAALDEFELWIIRLDAGLNDRYEHVGVGFVVASDQFLELLEQEFLFIIPCSHEDVGRLCLRIRWPRQPFTSL